MPARRFMRLFGVTGWPVGSSMTTPSEVLWSTFDFLPRIYASTLRRDAKPSSSCCGCLSLLIRYCDARLVVRVVDQPRPEDPVRGLGLKSPARKPAAVLKTVSIVSPVSRPAARPTARAASARKAPTNTMEKLETIIVHILSEADCPGAPTLAAQRSVALRGSGC